MEYLNVNGARSFRLVLAASFISQRLQALESENFEILFGKLNGNEKDFYI
jgi:hypothetical protein